jgi:hypothetical protein
VRQTASKTIEASIARTCGLRELDKHYDQQTLNASDDVFPHGIGLRDLFVMAARENGHAINSTSDTRTLLRAAFDGQGPQTIRAEGISTLSLPGIMSNIANKFLLQGLQRRGGVLEGRRGRRQRARFQAILQLQLPDGRHVHQGRASR